RRLARGVEREGCAGAAAKRAEVEPRARGAVWGQRVPQCSVRLEACRDLRVACHLAEVVVREALAVRPGERAEVPWPADLRPDEGVMDAAREVGGAGHLTRVVDAVGLGVAAAEPGDRRDLPAGAEPGHVVPVRVLPDAGRLADAVVG